MALIRIIGSVNKDMQIGFYPSQCFGFKCLKIEVLVIIVLDPPQYW